SAVGLLQVAPRGQRSAPVKHPDIVQTENPAFEEIVTVTIQPIQPPAKIQHQLAIDSFEELDISSAMQRLLGAMQKDRGPGVDRWISITKIPFIGWNLAGRMLIELLQHQVELVLGKIEVNSRECDRVEGQIPRGVPGIFPLVRHRYYVLVDHVTPGTVPNPADRLFQLRGAMILEPLVKIKEI